MCQRQSETERPGGKERPGKKSGKATKERMKSGEKDDESSVVQTNFQISFKSPVTMVI